MSADCETDFDSGRLVRLRQLMGQEIWSLVASFHATSQASLMEWRTAMQEGRDEDARAVVHRMRSALSQFGLLAAARAAEQFERRPREDDGLPMAQAFEAACQAGYAWLDQAMEIG